MVDIRPQNSPLYTPFLGAVDTFRGNIRIGDHLHIVLADHSLHPHFFITLYFNTYPDHQLKTSTHLTALLPYHISVEYRIENAEEHRL